MKLSGKKKVKKICKNCGEEFEVYPCREDSATYCSNECRYSKDGGMYDDVSETLVREVDLEVDKNFAYFLGAFYGDGYADCRQKKRNGKKWGTHYRIRIYPGLSKEFAEKCAGCLENVGLKPTIERRYANEKEFLVRVLSKRLHDYLKDLKFEDMLVEFGKEEKLYFIKGMVDSEGHVDFRGSREHVNIANSDKELIDFTVKLLKELGYSPSIGEYSDEYHNGNFYQILIYEENEARRILNGTVKEQDIEKYEVDWEEKE